MSTHTHEGHDLHSDSSERKSEVDLLTFESKIRSTLFLKDFGLPKFVNPNNPDFSLLNMDHGYSKADSDNFKEEQAIIEKIRQFIALFIDTRQDLSVYEYENSGKRIRQKISEGVPYTQAWIDAVSSLTDYYISGTYNDNLRIIEKAGLTIDQKDYKDVEQSVRLEALVDKIVNLLSLSTIHSTISHRANNVIEISKQMLTKDQLISLLHVLEENEILSYIEQK